MNTNKITEINKLLITKKLRIDYDDLCNIEGKSCIYQNGFTEIKNKLCLVSVSGTGEKCLSTIIVDENNEIYSHTNEESRGKHFNKFLFAVLIYSFEEEFLISKAINYIRAYLIMNHFNYNVDLMASGMHLEYNGKTYSQFSEDLIALLNENLIFNLENLYNKNPDARFDGLPFRIINNQESKTNAYNIIEEFCRLNGGFYKLKINKKENKKRKTINKKRKQKTKTKKRKQKNENKKKNK